MRRKIPSTAALAVFESAARHQSYTKAADELAVTQSAVCRQIASLEDFLGLRLFQRSRRGVALTEAGLNYSRQVRTRLDEVERDALELMARGAEGGTLELGSCRPSPPKGCCHACRISCRATPACTST